MSDPLQMTHEIILALVQNGQLKSSEIARTYTDLHRVIVRARDVTYGTEKPPMETEEALFEVEAPAPAPVAEEAPPAPAKTAPARKKQEKAKETKKAKERKEPKAPSRAQVEKKAPGKRVPEAKEAPKARGKRAPKAAPKEKETARKAPREAPKKTAKSTKLARATAPKESKKAPVKGKKISRRQSVPDDLGKRQILDVVQEEGAISGRQIQQKIDIGKNRTYHLLKELVEEGHLEQSGRATRILYSLPD